MRSLRSAMEDASFDRIAQALGRSVHTENLETMIDDRDVELDVLRSLVFGLVSDALSGLVDSTDLRTTSHPGRSALELTTKSGSMLELELGVVFRSVQR